MDLIAYAQIENLAYIAEQNGVSVPRLRGYRLMLEEEPYTEVDIERDIEHTRLRTYKSAVTSIPAFCMNPNTWEYSDRTDRLCKKYLINKKKTRDGFEYDETVGIRWDLIHGKRRKALKYLLKREEEAVRRNIETFNKYAGRKDVLCIYARLGGCNWNYYGGAEIEKQPWFLEKVDSYFDDTYCEIYAKIKEVNDVCRH